MENLQKIHALSSFMLGKKEALLKKTLEQAHQLVREKLDLPDNIRLTGLTFDHDDNPDAAAGCRTCTKIGPDGQLHVFCCPNSATLG